MLSDGFTDKEILLHVVKDVFVKTIFTYAIVVILIRLAGELYRPIGLVFAVLFVIFALYHILKRIHGLGLWIYLVIKRIPGRSWYLVVAHLLRTFQVFCLIIYCWYLYSGFYRNKW